MSTVGPSQPPVRQIRLLANLAPFAAIVFALLAVWLVVSAVRAVPQVLASLTGDGGPVVAALVLLVLTTAAAVVTALIAYRLGVEVPRTLRAWDVALAERSRALRGE